MKLKNQLLVWICSLFFVPILIFFIILVLDSYNESKKNYMVQEKINLQQFGKVYEDYLENIYQEMGILSEEFGSGSSEENNGLSNLSYINFLKKIKKDYNEIFYIDYLKNESIVNENTKQQFGLFFNEINSVQNTDSYADSEIPRGINDDFYISDVSNDEIILAKRVKTGIREWKVTGIVIPAEKLDKFYELEKSDDSLYYLIKNNGNILVKNDKVEEASFYSLYNVNKNTFKNEEGSFSASGGGKSDVIFNYRAINDGKLYIVVESSEASYSGAFLQKAFFGGGKIFLISVLIFLLMFYFFNKKFLLKIKRFKDSLSRLLGLEKKLVFSGNEYNLDDIIEKFSDYIEKTAQNSNFIDKSTGEINKKIMELKDTQLQNSELINRELEKMNHLRDEVGKITDLTEENSRDIDKLIKECIHMVKENKTIILMSESLKKSFKKLNESSINIEEMIEDINLISERTNLLSLNARKEAERVSEYGSSYLVIAEEIRNLSVVILEISNKVKEISHNVTERLSKSNQVMDLIISKINNLQDDVQKIDKNIKNLSENVNMKNNEENVLDSEFKELGILIYTEKEKLNRNAKLIFEIEELFNKISKSREDLKQEGGN